MALGIAFLFGLRLTTNFRQPYLGRTPQAFWQHWHITLSTWIRDYLYIPLGGGKGSFARQRGEGPPHQRKKEHEKGVS